MNWRDLKDVPYAIWNGIVTAVGGPAQLASREAWEAAKPHSALILAIMGVESRWGTTERLNRIANKNPLNLKQPLKPDGSREPGFMAFPSWVDGVRAARERITSKTYGGGVYADTVTILDLINVFAPSIENNVESYVRAVTAYLESWPRERGTDMPETRIPTIVLDAGHRSTDRTGNPAEMAMTPDLARAYRAELRRRGFEAYWYQEDLDRDSDPDETIGTLNTVAKGLGAWLSRQSWALMLSLHYDGPHSVLHAIVPDNVGLSTAYPEGRDPNDTAANNPLDRRLGVAIVDRMVRAGLGSPFRGMLGETGLMSEWETGVGRQGFRLAVMSATAPSRLKAVRLVIEHGGTSDPAARRFADFARAAADAIEAVYGTPGETPATTTTAAPKPTTTTTTTAGPSDLPPGMSQGLAEALYNPSAIVSPATGAPAVFTRGDPLSESWLAYVLLSNSDGGRWDAYFWPPLTSLTKRGDGRIVAQFGDGVVFEQAA